ncbi:juvenile hormone-binding protein [Manduca sexta]|uniref:juvenile hormone-binding protein n=1 Tax=Manduca sexta TaxID=7130 RepID=UPI00188F00FC|nr:juvenile hormone-binding protein [Manduca sexta]
MDVTVCNMNGFKVFLFLLFAKCVLSDQGALFEPCSTQDIACLSRATQQFLEKACRGVPEYDIRPIDPLIIPSLDVAAYDDIGLIFHFKNLNVTGLKNQKISDFRMDTTRKSVLLKTQADLNLVADVVIELSKQSKSFAGVMNIQASIIGGAKYSYDLQDDSKGVKHFEVGQETISCESIGEPAVNLNPELADALLKDPDTTHYRKDYEAHRVSIRQRSLCKIVELCYIDVVHNIRAVAKILPSTAFFTDVN